MTLAWPPPPLGLGTPLNLALWSAETRSRLRRSWLLAPVLGLATPLAMLAIDRALFAGVSLQRVRELGSQPLGFRAIIVVYSGVTEELIFRLLLATLVAWLAHLALCPFVRKPKSLAQWTGTFAAALAFGLAHVGNLPDVAHPVLRAVCINGTAGLVLGWLYFRHGLEMATVTHMMAIAVLYMAVPLLL